MNAKHRQLTARRRAAHRGRLRSDPELLALLRAAAAIAKPGREPDPFARRGSRTRNQVTL